MTVKQRERAHQKALDAQNADEFSNYCIRQWLRRHARTTEQREMQPLARMTVEYDGKRLVNG